jgi:VanZ family protein
MADTRNQDQLRKLMVRGLGWCLCLALWTTSLLTIFPVRVSQAVMPEAFHFPASKLLHISAYTFLTVYLKWLRLRRWRWLLLAFLSLHAFGTEFFQQFVPGRHGMISDVLIDHLGIALGLILTRKYWLPRSQVARENRGEGRGARSEKKELSSLTTRNSPLTTRHSPLAPAENADEQSGFFAR